MIHVYKHEEANAHITSKDVDEAPEDFSEVFGREKLYYLLGVFWKTWRDVLLGLPIVLIAYGIVGIPKNLACAFIVGVVWVILHWTLMNLV